MDSDKTPKKFLICVTGYPGSGKSVFASIGKEYGLEVYTMGDIVREEALKRYGKIDKNTLGKVAKELRREIGDDAIAILLSKKIEGTLNNIVIIDGIRSPREIEILSKIGDIFIVAILAKKATRYMRLLKRGREDDKLSYEDFIEREEREKGFGLEDVIGKANIFIYNEDISLEEFQNTSREIFEKVLAEVNEKEKNKGNNKAET